MALTPAKLSLLMFLGVGGLAAAYVGKTLLAKDETPAKVDVRTIPMALGDIEPGTVITEAHIGSGRIPSDKVEPDMLLSDRVVLDRVAKVKIAAGSAFRPDMLHPPGYRKPLAVAPGMVAVSVNVSDATDIVDGRLSPGQYVDVHLTVDRLPGNDDRLAGGLTLVLFRGVKLIGFSGAGGGGGRGSNSVTLEMTPKQANVMILAQDKGRVTLTYNPAGMGSGGIDVPDEQRVTFEQILGLQPVPPSVPPFLTEDFSGKSRAATEWQDGRRTDSGGFGADGEVGATSRPGSNRSGSAAVGTSASGGDGPSA